MKQKKQSSCLSLEGRRTFPMYFFQTLKYATAFRYTIVTFNLPRVTQMLKEEYAKDKSAKVLF